MQIWYIIGSIYSRPTHTDLFQSATCLNSFVAGKTDMICGRLLGFFQKQLGKKCFHNTVKSWRNEQVHSPTLIVIDGHIMDLWEIYFLLRDKLNEATLCREWLVITCIKLPYNAILSVWRSAIWRPIFLLERSRLSIGHCTGGHIVHRSNETVSQCWASSITLP